MPGDIHRIHSENDAEQRPPGATSRRLAAILAGDISGYSRLMQIDEDGTYARVRRIQRDLIEPTIAEHYGKLVKTTGDGFIAIFDSPVEAVRCGIVIQQSMIGRNAALPRQHWIVYRIGVNLGDVIVEEDDVYGDGVNVAARLEGIASPGHIYISGGIYEQVKHKLVCGYQSLGDRQIKNITDPVRVYRVLPDPAALMASRKRPIMLAVALSAITLTAAGTGLWLLYSSTQRPGSSTVQAPVPAPAATEMAKGTPTPATAIAPQAAPPTAQQSAPQAPPSTRPSASQSSARQDSAQPSPSAPPQSAPQTSPAATQQATQQPAPLTTPQAPQSVTPQAAPQAALPSASGAPAMNPPASSASTGPEMISLAGGSFLMGSNDDMSEKPIRRVTINSFALSKFPITNREWNQCAAAKACGFVAAGNDDAPVTNVSWNDAKQFVAWLSNATGKEYRLPSEAEWEYAARGDTQTRYWWGDQFRWGLVNCKNCTDVAVADQPVKVGTFQANPFGLYDMGGSVDQWVEDCWHKNYAGAPGDGTPWIEGGDCSSRVIRSGSWRKDAQYARPANRDRYDAVVRYPTHGFRIAVTR